MSDADHGRRAVKNQAWLDVAHLEGKVTGRSAKGGLFTMLAYGYEFGTRTAAMLILARILDPREIGLVGIVLLVSTFFMMFADVGLTAATIQAPSLTQAQASNLFWINGLLGIGLALLACLVSPLVSWFFGEPEVVPMLCLSALGFVACGLSFQHRALLQRQM
ncbi:MAG: oligosaccharide flippase family protein, partial [Verrucomicrobiales bacterium]